MAGKGTKNNQQNTQGDAQTEQAVQTKPLDFDVRIHSIKPNESMQSSTIKIIKISEYVDVQKILASATVH